MADDEGRSGAMPLTEPVSFGLGCNADNLVEAASIDLSAFYARMSKDRRLTIPKLIVHELSEGKVQRAKL